MAAAQAEAQLSESLAATSIQDGTDNGAAETAEAPEPSDAARSAKPKKSTPYINPERVKTGGAQRVSPTISTWIVLKINNTLIRKN
jgi:hypothetical protein